MLASAKRQNIPIVIAMVDIDFFKNVNDTYGHDAGDEVIKNISRILKSRFRESDIVCRFGGEEFCILAVNMDPEQSVRIFEELRKHIEKSETHVDGRIIKNTVSMGIYAESADSLDRMIKQADMMLYEAKKRGRNRIVCSGNLSA